MPTEPESNASATAAPTKSTGYGPSSSKRPEFDGNGEKFEMFESRLLSHMRRLKIHKIIPPESEGGVRDDALDAKDNAEVYAQLIQCLDDTSINLVFTMQKTMAQRGFGDAKSLLYVNREAQSDCLVYRND